MLLNLCVCYKRCNSIIFTATIAKRALIQLIYSNKGKQLGNLCSFSKSFIVWRVSCDTVIVESFPMRFKRAWDGIFRTHAAPFLQKKTNNYFCDTMECEHSSPPVIISVTIKHIALHSIFHSIIQSCCRKTRDINACYYITGI